jgi:hypothetical protein
MLQVFRLDGCWVVSEVENIPDQEWGDPDAVLKYPYEIITETGGPKHLEKYPPYSANRNEIYIRQSDITVTADADDCLAALYHTQRQKETE